MSYGSVRHWKNYASAYNNGTGKDSPQEDRLLEWMDAVDNVAIVRKEEKNKDARKRTEENLKLILPEDCLHQPVSQLSGGMKRRVALARAMNFPSKLIILDEPFTGLDAGLREICAELLKREFAGAAIVMITHEREDRSRNDDSRTSGQASCRSGLPCRR